MKTDQISPDEAHEIIEVHPADMALITPEVMQREVEIRTQLGQHVERALSLPDAVVNVQGGKHYTSKALTHLAGVLKVSYTYGEPQWDNDPLYDGARVVMVLCTATRQDGLAHASWGMASSAETSKNGNPRWTDAYALLSMAQTRARVRALNSMFMPAIAEAAVGSYSDTPYEDMPHDGNGGNQRQLPNNSNQRRPNNQRQQQQQPQQAGLPGAAYGQKLFAWAKHRRWQANIEEIKATLNTVVEARRLGVSGNVIEQTMLDIDKSVSDARAKWKQTGFEIGRQVDEQLEAQKHAAEVESDDVTAGDIEQARSRQVIETGYETSDTPVGDLPFGDGTEQEALPFGGDPMPE